MPKLPIKEKRRLAFLFERQWAHALFLVLMVPLIVLFAGVHLEGKSFLFLTDETWFIIALLVPIVHQVVVWLGFKSALAWGWFTKVFGEKDLRIWGMIFFPLLALRVISLLLVGLATRGTLFIDARYALLIGGALLVPALYTLYSVFRYFGVKRAMGADHFREVYQRLPLVKQGVFSVSNNAMYAYAFFLLWAVAFFTLSQVALLLAVFQHLYIWVHYHTVEKPHMRLLYETDSKS